MSKRAAPAHDLPPSSASAVEMRRDLLGTAGKIYSQYREELIIRDFFQDRPGGTFVDVGAGDPIKDSNTCYLERHLGWSGVGVDALPEYAARYAIERPRTRFRNFIVTDRTNSIEDFYHVKAAPGLSSTNPDRVWDGKKLNAKRIKVPTTALDDLLEAEGITPVDFLSIDVEESVLPAPAGLASSDFSQP